MAKFRKAKPKPDLKADAKRVAAAGRTGSDGKKDTEIVHLNKGEARVVDRVLKRYGGAGSRNPKTGAKEYKYGADTNEGGAHGFNGGGPGGKSTGSSDSDDKKVPTASQAPLAKGQALGSPQPLGGASGGDSLGGQGDAGDAAAAKSMGAHTEKQPGDVPAVKGADAVGIGARVLGGIGGAVASGLSQGLTGEDKTESLLGGEHFGKQVGWSGTGEDRGSRPGKAGEGIGATTATSAAGKPAAAATSASTSGSAAGGDSGLGGQTITVNPDGTLRTQDTSVAGLRAKRRYGAKTAAG